MSAIQHPQTQIQGHHETILIIDDMPTNLGVAVDYLEQTGFKTIIASDGELGLQRAKYVQPAIILLDIMMPEMDGYETCRQLKADEVTKEIPVIFMTGLSELEDKVKGFEAGGVDYVTKPFQPEELLARVNVHLTVRKLQQQLQQENARFQQLSEATFEGIMIHEAGRILDVNQAIVTLSGYPRTELIGKSLLDMLTPQSRDLAIAQNMLNNEQVFEAQALKKDGQTVPIEIQTKTMPWQGQDVRVAALRDISWRKQIEQEQQLLRRENHALRSTIRDRYKFGDIIGKSPAMQDVYQAIIRAAASDANVLIYGESGTGKELVAKTIHQQSERKERAFVAVNCGAVPETLFEREFFGHRRGAFTGATTDRPGYFDRAHKGTLFLDEVAELSSALQVKLLRALQDKEYMPLGDTVSKTVDVRIIAATNKELRELLQQGVIREDFFYRIRVIVINLPPLRDRKEDIPLLVDFFLEQYSKGKKPTTMPARMVDMLSAYHWPGNIRELQNELQRYLAEQHLEFIEHLDIADPEQDPLPALRAVQTGLTFREAVEAYEKRLIADALEQTAGHLGKTSAMLDIPQKTLYRKIRKYQLLGVGKG